MTIRATTPEDTLLAQKWALMHDREAAEEMDLPDIGCAAEDEDGPVAFVWAYEVPKRRLCFLENFVTRPGLQIPEAVEAGACLMAGIEAAVKSHGYSTLVAYSLGACARYLLGMGWEMADERPKFAMLKKI